MPDNNVLSKLLQIMEKADIQITVEKPAVDIPRPYVHVAARVRATAGRAALFVSSGLGEDRLEEQPSTDEPEEKQLQDALLRALDKVASQLTTN